MRDECTEPVVRENLELQERLTALEQAKAEVEDRLGITRSEVHNSGCCAGAVLCRAVLCCAVLCCWSSYPGLITAPSVSSPACLCSTPRPSLLVRFLFAPVLLNPCLLLLCKALMAQVRKQKEQAEWAEKKYAELDRSAANLQIC